MKSRITPVLFLALLSLGRSPAQTLDTTTFVVMGEGLAAGMANFGLSSVGQNQSFPAQIAAQMGTAFPQPLIQPPGIGDVVGYPTQEVRVQTYPQGSVRQFYQTGTNPVTSPPIFVLNLSVPELTLADSVSLRPVSPIVQRNMKQTMVNLILGFPQLFLDNVALWSQFEYAKAMFPTMAMVELGYYEALNAAVNGDPTLMPDPNTFGATYQSVLAGLRGLQAQVIATTIPNPIDTAYFSSPAAAASITATEPFVITAGYHITNQDYVTRNGLMSIANQFTNGAIGPLPSGSILTAVAADDITVRVNALNIQIVNAAKATGAVVYDLNAFLHNVRVNGVQAGTLTLTADYLGGFYSLDGVYPGPTGHALIANDILNFISRTYHRSFAPVPVSSTSASDPTVQMLKPAGERHSAASLGLGRGDGRQ
jgi:hypothetical protein